MATRRTYTGGGVTAPDLTNLGGGATAGLMRAARGNTAAELLIGFAGLAGTIQARRKREEKEEEKEHKEAGTLESLRQINIFKEKLSNAQGQDDWIQTSSAEREELIKGWIQEGQSAMSDWAGMEAGERFTYDAGVIGSQPIVAARERERKRRKAEVLSDVILARDNLIESGHDNARILASKTASDAEKTTAFQAIQVEKRLYDDTRTTGLGLDDLSPEQLAELREVDGGDDIVSGLILQAHISHAVENGTIDELAREVYDLRDPGGDLITQGMDPAVVDKKIAAAKRERTAELNLQKAEFTLQRERQKAEGEEDERLAKLRVLRSDNPGRAAIQEELRAGAEGDPDRALAVLQFADKLGTAKDDVWQDRMENDPEIRRDYAKDSLRLLNATTDEEVLDVQDAALRACQYGAMGLEGGMPDSFCTALTNQAEIAKNRVDQLDDTAKETIKLLAPVLRAKGMPSVLDQIDPKKGDVQEIAMLSALQTQALSMTAAGVQPQLAVDVIAHILSGRMPKVKLGDGSDEWQREQIRYKAEAAVAYLFGPGGVPAEESAFIDILMREDVREAIEPFRRPDGSLPRRQDVIDVLKAKFPAEAGTIYVDQVLSLQHIYHRARGQATPGEIAHASAQFHKFTTQP